MSANPSEENEIRAAVDPNPCTVNESIVIEKESLLGNLYATIRDFRQSLGSSRRDYTIHLAENQASQTRIYVDRKDDVLESSQALPKKWKTEQLSLSKSIQFSKEFLRLCFDSSQAHEHTIWPLGLSTRGEIITFSMDEEADRILLSVDDATRWPMETLPTSRVTPYTISGNEILQRRNFVHGWTRYLPSGLAVWMHDLSELYKANGFDYIARQFFHVNYLIYNEQYESLFAFQKDKLDLLQCEHLTSYDPAETDPSDNNFDGGKINNPEDVPKWDSRIYALVWKQPIDEKYQKLVTQSPFAELPFAIFWDHQNEHYLICSLHLQRTEHDERRTITTRLTLRPLPFDVMLPSICVQDMTFRCEILTSLLYTNNPVQFPLDISAIVSSYCSSFSFSFLPYGKCDSRDFF